MKNLVIYNSLGNKKEEFKPLNPPKVSVYVCGPTVYADPHIGNFRPVVVFDVLRRTLMNLDYDVTYVSNYTDVDDKIINRAKQLGITEEELTTSVIKEYRRLVTEVGSMQPDITPTPTKMMDKIIQYVSDLEEKGTAYAKDGDVYFRVKSVPDYGELSGNSIAALEKGARIDINDKKEDPIDFTLWKTTQEGVKWDSPWGKGRPGWHTECCVMINSLFKEDNGYIDIHGGGFDLKFPHHENEMAQSKAHNGNKLARYWIHNGFINIDNEKMSKSLGNVILMKDVVEEFGGLPFRLMTLAAHYRSPASFTEETIKEAEKKCNQLESTFRRASILLQKNGYKLDEIPFNEESKVFDCLLDDLNTPNALTELYEENKELNQSMRQREIDFEKVAKLYKKVQSGEWLLGLEFKTPVLSENDLELYKKYDEAKKNKDFALSDEIREQLIAKNIFN